MKLSRKSLLIALLAIALGGLLLAVCLRWSGARPSLEGLARSEQVPSGDSLHPIRIAVVLEPGLFEIDEEGQISGRMPRLAQRLLCGLHYTWVPVTDAELGLSLLDEQRADLLAADRSAEDAADDAAHLRTAPVDSVAYALVSLRDSLSWDEVLSGPDEVPVAYSRENAEVETILSNLHDISYTAIRPEELDRSPLEIVLEVMKQEVRYAVVKRTLAVELRERFPSLEVVTGVSFAAPQVWTLRADAAALRDTIDARMARDKHKQTK